MKHIILFLWQFLRQEMSFLRFAGLISNSVHSDFDTVPRMYPNQIESTVECPPIIDEYFGVNSSVPYILLIFCMDIQGRVQTGSSPGGPGGPDPNWTKLTLKL